MFFDHLGRNYQKGEISEEQELEIRKNISKLVSKSRKDCKLDNCYYCKKPTTSFCNSHFVPRFCLQNIGVDGEVKGPNSVMDLPDMGVQISKEHLGINASGTFHIICNDCDNMIFRDYENPDSYDSGKQLEQKLLAQIAMKNYLKFISKRLFERAMYKNQAEICKEQGITDPYFLKRQAHGIITSSLDLQTYDVDFKRACKIANNNDTGYYLIFYKLLDYVAPIAVQAPITLAIDLDGNVVNDVFNMDADYKPTELHLCIFPLKSKTAIIMFINDGDKRYRKFYKQFRKLDETEQLSIINYLVFLYCEDYFLARDLDTKVNLDVFKEVSRKMPIVWSRKPIRNTGVLADEFGLTKHNTIPNLLSEKYKVR